MVRSPWNRAQRIQDQAARIASDMATEKQYVVCLDNEGYQASLLARRIYQTLSDPEASSHGLLRVIDESGEDYLFPAKLFEVIELPTSLRQKLALG